MGRRPRETTPEDDQDLDFLHEAIRRCGGQQHVAKDLGVVQGAVSLWMRRGFIPKKYGDDIRRLARGPKSLRAPGSKIDTVHYILVRDRTQ